MKRWGKRHKVANKSKFRVKKEMSERSLICPNKRDKKKENVSKTQLMNQTIQKLNLTNFHFSSSRN
jgi:hypothetical protein